MTYGTKTNKLRSLKPRRFTIHEAMKATGLTYTECHRIIHKLVAQGELERVSKGDIGRFAKRKSQWKFYA